MRVSSGEIGLVRRKGGIMKIRWKIGMVRDGNGKGRWW